LTSVEPQEGLVQPGGERLRAVCGALIILALAAVLSVTAFYAVCVGFSFYDDMGCLMLTQKMLAAGHPLYDQTFTQYGPAYYAWEQFLHTVTRLPLSHDSTLLFTTVSWVMISLLCAGYVGRITRNLFLTALSCIVVFYMLGVLEHEPGHPQELCGLLLGGMLFASSFLTCRRHTGIILGVIGFLAGLLGMTKPNLGVFAALAGWVSLSNLVAARTNRNILFRAGVLVALVLPVALMRHNLGKAGAYCLLESGAILLLVFQLAGSRPEQSLSWKSFAAPVAGFAAALVACAGYALVTGTSGAGLIRGLVLQHAGFDRVFFRWPAFRMGDVLYSLGLASAVWAATGSGHGDWRKAPWVPAAVKCSVAPLMVLAACWVGPDIGPIFVCYLPLVVATAYPLPRQPRSVFELAPRQFAVSLAVLSALWGYPVWGSQASLSFFLLIPVAMVWCADGVRYGSLQFGKMKQFSSARRRVAGMALSYLAALGIIGLGLVWAGSAARAYHQMEPSGLRGSRWLRLPREQAEFYHRLIQATRVHGRSFFTMPGLDSLYFWAEEEPPTCINVPNWMELLTPAQQSKLVADLQNADDLCVICWNIDVKFWTCDRDISGNKVVRYIKDNFIGAESFDGCDILVRRSQSGTTAK
jgi:hypothetical protein